MTDRWWYPPVCPLLKKWIGSEDAKDWVKKFEVEMDWRIERVIADSMWALQCYDYNTWSQCIDLEGKQKRI